MEIMSVSDRRIKKIVETPGITSVKGLDKQQTRRIIEMVAAIRVMSNPLQLLAVPSWRAHELVPGRPNVWSLRVTPNFRLTFLVEQSNQEVHLLDLEDYH
jgi:proteic killer suppression protein